MKNYIDGAKFEAIIRDLGVPATEQAGFVKVQGPTGRNLYVARTKRVGRVDLSGFTSDVEGVVAHSHGEFGNVKQELDFSRTEEQVLATFTQVLEDMMALEPLAKPARKAPARKDDGATGWSGTLPKADRKRLIAARAEVVAQADSAE